MSGVNDVALGKLRIRVGGINCLSTLPEYRRQGLGSQIMRAAHQRMAELGCQVGLLGTHITNWYRKLGWELAGRARWYRLDRSNIKLLPALPANTEVEMAAEERAIEVVRLRNGDCLGGIRQPASFSTVMRAKGNPQVVLAYDRGLAVAYLLIRERTVIEWGGAAELVAGLVRAWFKRTDNPDIPTSAVDESRRPLLQDEITLVAPAEGHLLVEMLQGLRMPCNNSYLGVMYVLDPKGLLQATGHTDIVISEKDIGFSLLRGPERVDLAQCELAKQFFGPERVSDFAGDVFPLWFWQWSLDKV